MAALFLSAAHKSSGKTTLAIGINAVLARRGLRVQPFKKGPDYIDPIWLGMAAGRPCYNLDYFVAGVDATIAEFQARRRRADIAVIEGNKGLYDGLDLDGSNSNAALAGALGTPVVLVIDVRGTMRGIAPLLLGYQAFAEAPDIAGVIANLAGGPRHEAKLRAAVETYTDLPWLGALANDPSLELAERHLGLIPGYEDPDARRRIERIADAVEARVDIERLIDIAGRAPAPAVAAVSEAARPGFDGLRIGIVRDRAFGFYYPGDLEAFERAGARLVPVDALADHRLPAVDGLFIGGGFPERHAAALAANQALRGAIAAAIEDGLPAYAECGGLMYLTRGIEWHGERHPMVGAIEADTVMHQRPQGRGYVRLAPDPAQHPWPDARAAPLQAHEFHYSSLRGLPADTRFAWRVERGHGVDGRHDGIVRHNLLASYAHQRDTAGNPWVRRFLRFVQTHCRPAAGAAAAYEEKP